MKDNSVEIELNSEKPEVDLHKAITELNGEFKGAQIEIENQRITKGGFKGSIRIKFEEWVGLSPKSEASKKISSILRNNNLDIVGSSINTYQPSDVTFTLEQRFYKGKINWRRWKSFPEKYDQKDTDLLDKIAEFTELYEDIDRKGGDDITRFSTFLNSALNRGLINKEEDSRIRAMNYYVNNAM